MKKILLFFAFAFQICNTTPTTLRITNNQTNTRLCYDVPTITWEISQNDPTIKSYVLLIKGINEQLYAQQTNIQGGYGINGPIFCPGNIIQMFYNIPSTLKALPTDWKISGEIVELKPYGNLPCASAQSICRYEAVVHAIDIVLNPEKIKTFDDLTSQINGHIIATGSAQLRFPL